MKNIKSLVILFVIALGVTSCMSNAMDEELESGETTSTISNVLKTKHDTAKNAISNIR